MIICIFKLNRQYIYYYHILSFFLKKTFKSIQMNIYIVKYRIKRCRKNKIRKNDIGMELRLKININNHDFTFHNVKLFLIFKIYRPWPYFKIFNKFKSFKTHICNLKYEIKRKKMA